MLTASAADVVAFVISHEVQMPTGKVKKIVHEKGFGFIQPQSGSDVFFHNTSVADGGFDRMNEGQQVEFEVEQGGGKGGKGPRATSVKPV